MKNGFVKKNKIFGINMLYLLSILPIIIFSLYKNGFLAYKAGIMSIFLSIQYIIVPIIIIVLSYVFESYYYLIVKKDDNNDNVVNSIVPYINTLCYLVCGPLDKLYICIPLIIVIDVIMKFLDTKISVNRVALFKCLLFGVLTAFGLYNDANLNQVVSGSSDNGLMSLFIGNGIGEIGTTSTLFALIGYVILLFNKYYKKDIPVICLIGYMLFSLILYFAGTVTFTQLLTNTFNSGFIFICVFVASLSVSTPVVRSGRVIYALVVGILSSMFINLVEFNVGVYFVILIVGLVTPLLNKFKLVIE